MELLKCIKMHKFIQWNSFEFKQTSGKEKIACPTCQANKNRKLK